MEIRQVDRIGELLVKDGDLTPFQLQKALQIQKESRERVLLGEIAARCGYVHRKRLGRTLRKYRKGILVGKALIDAGWISDENVDFALARQADSGRKLGDILVKNGYVSERHLAEAIAEQLNLPFIIPDPRIVDPKVFRKLPPSFIRNQSVVLMSEKQGVVTAVSAEPLSEAEKDQLRSAVGSDIRFAIGPKSMVTNAIEKLLARQTIVRLSDTMEEEKAPDERRTVISEMKEIRLRKQHRVSDILDFIIYDAYERNASDINIEPDSDTLRIRFRLDGVLVHMMDLPKNLMRRLLARIKSISGLDVTGVPRNQEGRINATIAGDNVDIRVSIVNALCGENITLCLLAHQKGRLSLDRLGMHPMILQSFREVLDFPSGVILFTGPANCGKTATLYAALDYLNDGSYKIVTMENPIERTLPGVVQTRIDFQDDKAVERAFKEMLHQNPDILVVGDIRGGAVARLVMESALAGQKVFATLNATDSARAVMRLLSMGVSPYLLASSVSGILSQRLVRVLCEKCWESTVPESNMLNRFNFRGFSPDDYEFFTAKGCPECANMGFKGQSGIFEFMIISETIRRLISEEAPGTEIAAAASGASQFIPLKADGFLKALECKTSLDEVLRASPFGLESDLSQYSVETLKEALGESYDTERPSDRRDSGIFEYTKRHK